MNFYEMILKDRMKQKNEYLVVKLAFGGNLLMEQIYYHDFGLKHLQLRNAYGVQRILIILKKLNFD